MHARRNPSTWDMREILLISHYSLAPTPAPTPIRHANRARTEIFVSEYEIHKPRRGALG